MLNIALLFSSCTVCIHMVAVSDCHGHVTTMCLLLTVNQLMLPCSLISFTTPCLNMLVFQYMYFICTVSIDKLFKYQS